MGGSPWLYFNFIYGGFQNMSNDYPFIKLFKTIDCFYLFDVNTASIIRINEEVCDYLESILMMAGRGQTLNARIFSA